MTPRSLVSLSLVSAAALLFEIALTRMYSIAHGHHFAFVAIAMALLGIGGSGTLIATSSRLAKAAPVPTIGLAGVLFAATAIGGSIASDWIPLDTYRLGADAVQLVWLVLYFFVAAVPFTFSGIAVVVALRVDPDRAGIAYGTSLAGSAAGAVLAIPLLSAVGPSGTVLLSGAVATSALVSMGPRWVSGSVGLAVVALSTVALLIPPAGPAISVHAPLHQALLRPEARRIDTVLSTSTRVDVIKDGGVRTATGLSLNYEGSVASPRIAIMVDGGDPSSLDIPVGEYLDHVPLAHAVRLRPTSSALVLDPIGAFTVAVLEHAGIPQVSVVQPDGALRQAWQHVGDLTPLADARVHIINRGVRSALRSERNHDIIVWPLREAFQGVAAGTFGLRETYGISSAALTDGWHALTPTGRLVITRWLQATPSESVRMWSAVVSAARASGLANPADHLLAWRSLEVVTMVGSPTAFTADERERLGRQLTRDGFDWVYHAGLNGPDSNRFNRLPDQSLFRAFADVVRGDTTPSRWAAVTDNRPYFFHFFDWSRWRDVAAAAGRTWQPFGGAGFLILVPLAVISTFAAILSLIAPLAIRGRSGGRGIGVRQLTFFAMVGVAFTVAQLALLQRLILVLDTPTYAFATGLAAMLLWAGLGSVLSRRWRFSPRVAAGTSAVAVLILGVLLVGGSAALGTPLGIRMTLGVVIVGPVIVFGAVIPSAIRLLSPDNAVVAWAWAVNGTASVAAAFAAEILLVSIGFTATLAVAAAAYVSAALVWRANPLPQR